jgi:hypothetical protein
MMVPSGQGISRGVPARPDGATPRPVVRAGSVVVFHVDAEHTAWAARLRGDGRRWLPDQARRPPLRPIVDESALVERLRGGDHLLVAIQHGRPAGACWIGTENTGPWRSLPARAGYVTELVVAEGLSVTTVADVLLHAVRRLIFAAGGRAVRLACGSGNRTLRAYLSRLRYRQVGVYRPPKGTPMVLFEQRHRGEQNQPDSSAESSVSSG